MRFKFFWAVMQVQLPNVGTWSRTRPTLSVFTVQCFLLTALGTIPTSIISLMYAIKRMSTFVCISIF